ncbi:MAG: CHRD domain-containing protein [Planctomycetota bacterium]
MNTKTLLLVVAACGVLTTVADATPIVATAQLDASQEPGPFSTSGALGAAVLSVEPLDGTFDFSLEVTGIRPSDLADLGLGEAISSIHIHNAPFGSNGPVVIDLGGGNTNANVTSFGNGGFSLNIDGGFFGGVVGDDLAAANQNLAALLTEELYINVHTNDFLGGAIRGQLSVVQRPNPVVPEPASVTLVGLTVFGIVLRRPRRGRE